MRTIRVAATLASFALVASSLDAQVTVSNLPFNGVSTPGGFQHMTFAQSFQTPDALNTRLTEFRTYVGADRADVPYTVRVLGFNSVTRVAGAVLDERVFAQAPIVPDGNVFSTPLLTFGYDLSLAAATEYLFAVTYTTPAASLRAGLQQLELYPAGGMFYWESQVPGSSLTGVALTAGWVPDLAFSATFSPVAVTAIPEPTTVALLATGLLALGGVTARRRRRAD